MELCKVQVHARSHFSQKHCSTAHPALSMYTPPCAHIYSSPKFSYHWHPLLYQFVLLFLFSPLVSSMLKAIFSWALMVTWFVMHSNTNPLWVFVFVIIWPPWEGLAIKNGTTVPFHTPPSSLKLLGGKIFYIFPALETIPTDILLKLPTCFGSIATIFEVLSVHGTRVSSPLASFILL